MKISNIAVAIKSIMKSNVEVSTLLNEINRVQEAIGEDNTASLYRSFANAYDGKYNSKHVKVLMDTLAKASNQMGPNNIFERLALACEICARELRSMSSLVGRDNIEVILKENLEVKQGYIIHFLASAEFMDRYLRTMLIVVTELESSAFRGEEPERNTLRYLEETLQPTRILALTRFSDYLLEREKVKVIDDIYKMPAIDVDEATITAVTASEGKNVIDPSNLNATSLIGDLLNLVNPVAWAYASQKLWSEYLLYRLEESEKEIQYLGRRHLELIEQRDNGGATVNTAKSIERYRDEIVRVRAKIKRTREKLEG
jgi:hypothetical protein